MDEFVMLEKGLYARKSSIIRVKEGYGGDENEVQIIYVERDSDFISLSDWERVKPLILGESAAPSELVAPEVSTEEKPPAPDLIMNQVTRVKRKSFFSSTSNSQRPQWCLFTLEGTQVNVFDHSDPLRDHKPLLEASGYLSTFEDMEDGDEVYWATYPIEIAVTQSGKFWNLESIKPRPADAQPDAPTASGELTPDMLAVCKEAAALLERDDIAIVDAETTGTAADDEVVEIGSIDATGAMLVSTLIKPSDLTKLRRVGKKGKCAVDIHGITEYDLADAPAMSLDILKPLRGKTWVAFNVEYDERLIRQSWSMNELPDTFPRPDETICVQQMMNRYLGRRFTSLAGACEELGITRTEEHRAMGDAVDTHSVLYALAEKWKASQKPADVSDIPF